MDLDLAGNGISGSIQRLDGFEAGRRRLISARGFGGHAGRELHKRSNTDANAAA